MLVRLLHLCTHNKQASRLYIHVHVYVRTLLLPNALPTSIQKGVEIPCTWMLLCELFQRHFSLCGFFGEIQCTCHVHISAEHTEGMDKSELRGGRMGGGGRVTRDGWWGYDLLWTTYSSRYVLYLNLQHSVF